MDKMKIHFPNLDEEMEQAQPENGLRIYYIPKPDFAKTFAMFATNFGSIDSCFTLNGKETHTPDGVAHFLEHKMFEDVDGNALQKFARTGASPNAYTSYTMTAYHFSCMDHFEENLRILLKFVTTPYFTDENVEKEKGIIGQEIGMIHDSPGWIAYTNALKGLYAYHTVRNSIAGSVESIAEIDKNLLFLCHRAFYTPANMVLVVCGQAKMDTIIDMATEILPKESTQIAARNYGKAETPFANCTESWVQMSVSLPIFTLGIKNRPLQTGESRMQRELIAELALEYFIGESSPLYNKLYQERLISDGFESEYFLFPGGSAVFFGGESRDPKSVQEQIVQALENLKQIDENRLKRVKKYDYGIQIRQLDDPGAICRAQAEAAFAGEDFLNFDKLYTSISSNEILTFLKSLADPKKITLSVVEPKGKTEEL